MKQKLAQLQAIVQSDPAVDSVVGFTGGGQTNSGFVFVSLKPLAKRRVSADTVVGAAARQAGPGSRRAAATCRPSPDLRIGGRQSNAMYQFTLQADDTQTLYHWTPLLTAAMQKLPMLTDVNSDQQQGGLQSQPEDRPRDRRAARRQTLAPSTTPSTTRSASGRCRRSTAPSTSITWSWRSSRATGRIPRRSRTSGSRRRGPTSGTQTTNSGAGSIHRGRRADAAAAIAANSARNLAINSIAATRPCESLGRRLGVDQPGDDGPAGRIRQLRRRADAARGQSSGPFVATTISFNLAPGHALSEAQKAIREAMADIRMPSTIRGTFAGTAATYQQSLSNEPLLIVAALVAVYIVLGVLYESYIHPLTIISTLPSASVGALLALELFDTEFTIISLIGIILLIGIVKKNAIMMIDFALQARARRAVADARRSFRPA